MEKMKSMRPQIKNAGSQMVKAAGQSKGKTSGGKVITGKDLRSK